MEQGEDGKNGRLTCVICTVRALQLYRWLADMLLVRFLQDPAKSALQKDQIIV